MESFEDALKELRVEFVREGAERIQGMRVLLDRLAAHPRDAESLAEMRKRFHGFAGSGTTYGFPAVTELGLRGERECLTVRDGGTATPESIENWRGLVDEIGRNLGEVEPEPRSEEAAWARSPVAHRPIRVLVVDDDPQICELLTKTLEPEGFQVTTARSRAEATRHIDDWLPDGLIVDVLLGDESGYALVEDLRARAGGDLPTVLMISVRTDFLDKVEAIHCGADGYFEKPLDWQALAKRLRLLLGRTQQEETRVLCVEDEPLQAAFVRAVLESAGYVVRVCANPKHFESDLVSFAPDLVTMDIMLPGMSGYDLVKFIRQDTRYATLPVIMLTTEGEVEARVRAARSGGDEHLVKPVQPSLLLSVVAARIERARFLKSLLDRDGLTGLFTHTALLERARALVSLFARTQTRPPIWVMIDIDHFKSVNDRYGHPVGDRVLVALSSLLRRRLRQSDTIGRYGGEEFAVLLDGLSEVEAIRLVKRLLEEFASMNHAAGTRSFNVTFSAGVAVLASGFEMDAWRDEADRALYRAKTAGRNRVVARVDVAV
jgi:diguanylate cyclase (GGDEF)-like protein